MRDVYIGTRPSSTAARSHSRVSDEVLAGAYNRVSKSGAPSRSWTPCRLGVLKEQLLELMTETRQGEVERATR